MHLPQDLGVLEFSWTCVGMGKDDDFSPLQSCTNSKQQPIGLSGLSVTDTAVNGVSVMKFMPRTLHLHHDRMYKFNVEVREPLVPRGCYDTTRIALESTSVLIGPKGEDTMPELKIVVCLKLPCECDTGTNEKTKFNPGTKLVLRTCTSEPVQTHDWTAKFPVADNVFRSPTGYGTSKQSFVTVTMGSEHLAAS